MVPDTKKATAVKKLSFIIIGARSVGGEELVGNVESVASSFYLYIALFITKQSIT
jgi:hypothetical protein